MVWCHSFLVVQNKLFIRFMGFFFMFCSHVSSNLVSHGATVYSNLVFLWGGWWKQSLWDQTIIPKN